MENIPYELIARYLAGECNDNEKQQIQEWIRQHPDAMDEFSKIWQQIPSGIFTPDVENALLNVNQRIDSHKKSYTKRFLVLASSAAVAAIAAILILIHVIGAGSQDTIINTSSGSLLTFTTSEKETKEYTLPDGSKVWLNNLSTIRYPESFTNDTREVYLEGEAFFDIAPDKNKPFIIHANNTQTRVVGTSFGIRAVKDESEVIVTVSTGIINFSAEGRPSHIELKQGEQGVCKPEQRILEKNGNPDPNLLAWKTKVLVFKQTPLTEVAKVIEDVYHIPVSVDNSISGLQITSTFDQLSLDEVLQIIGITLGVKIESRGNEIIIGKE